MAQKRNLTELCGLSQKDVDEAVAKGEVNTPSFSIIPSISSIFRNNLCTLFNLVNVILAILLFSAGSYTNMLFLVIVVLNVVIGILQQLRARHALLSLQLLTEAKVTVVRGGKSQPISPSKLVEGDIISLNRGDQIPADAIVRTKELYVNEALLTGEQAPCLKKIGDELLSGSYVTAGRAYAQITHVGDKAYVASVATAAAAHVDRNYELKDGIAAIIKACSAILLPMGALLYVSAIMQGQGWREAVIHMSGALVGMIPQGLVLLVSTVLAISVWRLATRNILVQNLYATESLARIDRIAFDKTGTLTTSKVTLHEIRPLGEVSDSQLKSVIRTLCRANNDSGSPIPQLLLDSISDENRAYAIKRAIPFSSDAGFMGVVLSNDRCFVMGAPEILHAQAYAETVNPEFHCLVVCEVNSFDERGMWRGEPQACGLIAFQNELRPHAKEIVQYFYQQGVSVRIISGDSARSASAIARLSGVENANKAVDMRNIASEEEFEKVAREMVVFGRTNPVQKQKLIEFWKRQEHNVAMVGDGVNDVGALHEADCSISMAQAAPAARSIADIVLINNDFEQVPSIVALGRQNINNLSNSATLFLEKTVFSVLLSVITLFIGPYPFVPIQLTLISTCCTGFPSFAFALEPNKQRIQGHFLRKAIGRALPASFAIVTCITVLMVLRIFGVISADDADLIADAIYAAVSVCLLFKIARPYTLFRLGVITLALAGVLIGAIFFPSFFEIAQLTPGNVFLIACVACVASLTYYLLRKLLESSKRTSSAIEWAVKKLLK